jgi:hypothetical protein
MSRTTDAIRTYHDNPDAIVAAGEVVDIRFREGDQLSLRAAKVFHLLVQAAGVDIVENRTHRLSFSELNKGFHLSIPELEEVIAELHSTTVSLKLTDDAGRDYVKSGPILSDVEREREDLPKAEIRFEFSKTLQLAVADSNHWTILSRRAVLAFESKYSLRLYTLLSLRAGLRKTSEVFELQDLRRLLGIAPSAYPNWANFAQRVLKPTTKEINHIGGFVVGFTPLKIGRKISAVRLTWSRKSREEQEAAFRELEASRVGRKVRRDDTAVYIAQAEKTTRQAIAYALSASTGPRPVAGSSRKQR